jgi:hypothetical protein
MATNQGTPVTESVPRHILLSRGSVRYFLGHPYTGSQEDDRKLIAAVIADGGPGWLRNARVECVGDDVRLVRTVGGLG